nr:hypothetical protein [Clostridium paraputrificum]
MKIIFNLNYLWRKISWVLFTNFGNLIFSLFYFIIWTILFVFGFNESNIGKIFINSSAVFMLGFFIKSIALYLLLALVFFTNKVNNKKAKVIYLILCIIISTGTIIYKIYTDKSKLSIILSGIFIFMVYFSLRNFDVDANKFFSKIDK